LSNQQCTSARQLTHDHLADGISIPSSYTSFVAPLSSAKLYSEVAAFGQASRFETPYVVLFSAVHELTPAQPAWTFQHPLRDAATNNIVRRYCSSRSHVKRPANPDAILSTTF
jgi:hypothetical protein